jgi:hypothetical protein
MTNLSLREQLESANRYLSRQQYEASQPTKEQIRAKKKYQRSKLKLIQGK